ncbi:YccF domain-containing protein [Blautia obeum]|uniref:YccF domain-containing protein n=2 Tax=Lachnospiraceae TaxID=186803 RepID=UPI00321A9E2B
MGCLGNVLWFVFGGAVSGLSWCLAGCLWCITVVGIPVGMQCFKFAALSFFPFGKEVQYGGGAGSFLLNIIWLIVSGLPLGAVGGAYDAVYMKRITEYAELKYRHRYLAGRKKAENGQLCKRCKSYRDI